MPLATLLYRQERLAVIAFEYQQVVGTLAEDLDWVGRALRSVGEA